MGFFAIFIVCKIILDFSTTYYFRRIISIIQLHCYGYFVLMLENTIEWFRFQVYYIVRSWKDIIVLLFTPTLL